VFIGNNNDEVIFECTDIDSREFVLGNAEFNEHKIDFKDIDGDGILEILDTEIKGMCN